MDSSIEANINLIFEDSKCKAKAAASAAKKLINVDNFDAIIGELCSSATLAAAPMAQNNGVPMISPASTAPEVSQQGGFIFRTIPSDKKQGKFGAKQVAEEGHKRLAVLYVNGSYGTGFEQVLQEELLKEGGKIVESTAFKKGATSLRTQLTKIKASEPDAIFIISNSPDSSVASLEQIKELGIDAEVYGSEGLKSKDILQADKAAEGLKVVTLSKSSKDFVEAHQKEYNQKPGPFAAQGYDAFQAIAETIEKDASTSKEIKKELYNIEFTGASGKIKFDDNGDVPGNFRMLQVKDGEFKEVKK